MLAYSNTRSMTPRPYARKAWSAPRPEALLLTPIARKVLAERTAAGNDPREDAYTNRRGTAISEGHRRNREWKRGQVNQRRTRVGTAVRFYQSSTV